MGARIFSRMAFGEDAYDAYDDAAASDSEGCPRVHNGFSLVEVPKDVKLSTWLDALKAGNLPQELQMHAAEFNRQFVTYDDKRRPILCFEIIDQTRKDGLKQYFFTGWVPD
jgi:hypothetical protein